MITRTAGWLTLFVIGTDLFVMSPLLPDIRRGLSVSVSAAGWTVTVFALAYLAGGPILGALSDRIGHHRILAAALVAFAAANLLSGLATTLTALLAARVLAGLAASGVTPSVYALISAAAPAGRRASWLAAATSGLLLALATGAPAGSLLASAVSWHGVFYVLTAAALLVLALICLTRARRHSPARPVAVPGRVAAGSTPGRPGRLARLRAVGVTALWALAVYQLYTYLGTILTGTVHLPAVLVALALACYGAGAVAGNLLSGALTDRYGGRRVSVVALLALAVAEAVFGLTLHAPAGVLLAVLGVLALAAYPFFSAQQARLVGRFSATAGSVLAWNNSALYAGILVGSIAGGPLLSAYGARVLAGAAAGAAALAALAAAPATAADRHPAVSSLSGP